MPSFNKQEERAEVLLNNEAIIIFNKVKNTVGSSKDDWISWGVGSKEKLVSFRFNGNIKSISEEDAAEAVGAEDDAFTCEDEELHGSNP